MTGKKLENMRIFDFEISEEDMQSICSLDNGQRIGHNPDRGVKERKSENDVSAKRFFS